MQESPMRSTRTVPRILCFGSNGGDWSDSPTARFNRGEGGAGTH